MHGLSLLRCSDTKRRKGLFEDRGSTIVKKYPYAEGRLREENLQENHSRGSDSHNSWIFHRAAEVHLPRPQLTFLGHNHFDK